MAVDWSKVEEGTEVICCGYQGPCIFIFKRTTHSGGIVLNVIKTNYSYIDISYYPHEDLYKSFRPKIEYLFEENM